MLQQELYPLVTLSGFFASSQPLDLPSSFSPHFSSSFFFPLSTSTPIESKTKHSESAQRSRARKSLFVKSLEAENRELRRELFRLRAVVEAAVAGGQALHPSALVPPPSFAAAAGGVAAAGAAAYFAGEREMTTRRRRKAKQGRRGSRRGASAASAARPTPVSPRGPTGTSPRALPSARIAEHKQIKKQNNHVEIIIILLEERVI